MTESFDLETRQQIYHLIEQNPGLNLTHIAKYLSLNIPLVDYHTRQLEDQELITIVKEGGFKRYYIKGKIGTYDQKVLNVLRQDIPLRIVLFLLQNPRCQHKEILAQFDVAASTLTYHLNKLMKLHILVKEKTGHDHVYSVNNSNQVMHFLMRYRPSRVLKRFSDTWDDFGIP